MGAGFELDMTRWLLSSAARDSSLEQFCDVFASRLVDAGIPVTRMVFGFSTRHPSWRSLAVFPVHDDPTGPCRRALAAARAALDALDRWNLERPDDTPVRIGVALHVGTVLYGNVGAQDRLDFTVIGATVNEVCRLEALCRPLGESLLMSAEFAAHIGTGALRDRGAHLLKGVARPVQVFADAEPRPGLT